MFQPCNIVIHYSLSNNISYYDLVVFVPNEPSQQKSCYMIWFGGHRGHGHGVVIALLRCKQWPSTRLANGLQ